MELQRARMYATPCSNTLIPIPSGIVFLPLPCIPTCPTHDGLAFTRTFPSPSCASKMTTGNPFLPGRVTPLTSSFLPPTPCYSAFSQQQRGGNWIKYFRALILGKWPVAYHYLFFLIIHSRMTCGQRWSA